LSGQDAVELARLIEALPEPLARQALTHSSWVEHRADSYGRLAFLGDSVLGLAVASELFGRFSRSDIGRLTKVQNQVVSGRACARVAEALDVPAMLNEAAPLHDDTALPVAALVGNERPMASVLEALIGACYLNHGFEATAAAVVDAFAAEIELAVEARLDFKSELQERLARSGSRVTYGVVGESGPPHRRLFEVTAGVEGKVIGTGTGRTKKAAEQAAAQQALESLAG
jgi:ribonuclease-3